MAEFSWPEGYEPERSPVHVRNEVHTAAPPAAVWAWMVRAERWPEWYSNSKRVRVDGGGDLRRGSDFSWWTFGNRVKSKVREFEPNERLAWDAKEIGGAGYHAWLFVPENGGTHVITEETQHGPSIRLIGPLLQRMMLRGHQNWVDSLGETAAAGPPE